MYVAISMIVCVFSLLFHFRTSFQESCGEAWFCLGQAQLPHRRGGLQTWNFSFPQCPTHVSTQRTHIKGLCKDDYMSLPCQDDLGSKLAAHRSHDGAGTGTGHLYGGVQLEELLESPSEIITVSL